VQKGQSGGGLRGGKMERILGVKGSKYVTYIYIHTFICICICIYVCVAV
jgi:hypothetical protein